jgi:hypothetical protein
MWDYFEYVIPRLQEKYHLIIPARPRYDEELIPEMSQGQRSNLGTIFFTVGFTVMFALM